jgi:S-adenosylmethionine synthetase
MIKFFSSESVTEGHPDKVADRISDAILDACLKEDPKSRVACETAVTTDYCMIFGEITSHARPDFEAVIREAIQDIGYVHDDLGYDAKTVKIDIKIKPQSPDIALGVNQSDIKEMGAGDQGLMFGYANRETEVYMPLPIYLAHQLALRLALVRKKEIIQGLRPDGKTQVTVAYDENNKPKYIDTVVLSTQHDPNLTQVELKKLILQHVIEPTLKNYDTSQTTYQINPTGRFVVGGPNGDAGITGRKIIVDTYGGYARHGGGAFSGKDATKVDRSATYMARYLAKNIVASGIADACEIQIAYAIGVAKPVSLHINTFGSEKVSLESIYDAVNLHFDLTPKGIIRFLDLNRPIFAKTAAYGHFGREDKDFTWEKLDSVAFFSNLR